MQKMAATLARTTDLNVDQRSVFDTVTSLEAYRAGTLMQVCLMHKLTQGIVTKLASSLGCCDLCDIVHLPTLPHSVITKMTIWMQLADLLGRQLPSYVQDPTQPSAFFISGPGGTGKTTVYDILLASVRCQSRVALAVASSGVAALLSGGGGGTEHSRFKVPFEVDGSTQSK